MTQSGLTLPDTELQTPLLHLQCAQNRPLRLDACGDLALPSRGVLHAEPGDGASAWLLQLASLHRGVCGWLQQTDTGLALWPLAGEWALPRPAGVLVDAVGAQEAACLSQLQRWLAALGPDPLLLVDDADQLPVAMQRALRQALNLAWPVAVTRLPGVPATPMPPLQVDDAARFLHLASGWQWSGDLVHVLMDDRPTRRALWQHAVWLLQRGLCAPLADLVAAEVGLDPASVSWQPAGEPAPQDLSLPHTTRSWLTYLDQQLARGFGDRAEAAFRAWMVAHPPQAGTPTAALVTAWLQARAQLALPPVSGTEAAALVHWLDQPWDPQRGVAEAELAFRAGQYDAAAQLAQRVVASATEAHSQQTLQQGLLWLAFAHTWGGDGAAATQALAALQQMADLPAEVAHAAQYLTALLAYYAGQLDVAEGGFAALEALGEHPLAAAAASGLGLVAHRRGDLVQARSRYQLARNLAWTLGDRLRALNMAMNLAVLDHESGDLTAALQQYDAVLQQAEALGNRGAWLRARLNQCNLLTLLGCDEEARLAISAALAELNNNGVALLCWNAHQLLAEIARRQGALQVAAAELALAQVALDGMEARTERWEWRLEQGWQQLTTDVAAAKQTATELVAQIADYPEWQARAEHLALTADLAALEWAQPADWRPLLQRAEAALARAPASKPMVRLAIALDVVRLAVLAADLPRARVVAADQWTQLLQIRQGLAPSRQLAFGQTGVAKEARALLPWLLQWPAGTDAAPAVLPVGQSALQTVLAINRRLSEVHELQPLLDIVMDAAILLTGAERGFLLLSTDATDKPHRRAPDHEVGDLAVRVARNLDRENLTKPAGRLSHTIASRVFADGERVVTTDASQDARFADQVSVHSASLRSILCVPLLSQGVPIGVLYVDNRFAAGAFAQHHVALLDALADQAAIAIANARLVERLQASAVALQAQQAEVAALNDQLQQRLAETETALDTAREDLSVQRLEVQKRSDFAAIKGESPKLHQLFALMERVREHDFPVLVRGESGTGKELVARAMHFTGRRRKGPFVAVNCGALPSNLLESELFGHARGAFTGAVHERRGLFEAAHGGTLLLDEVGEMPPDMQVKLLRVLQNGEVMRVGEQQPRKVDVRVIAATHRDLQAMVRQGAFREDLLYRLQVIELIVPPLRERPEDLPPLVDHFLAENRRTGVGQVERLTPKALQLLRQFAWPGNVRQLETVLKSACVFAEGSVLDIADIQSVLPQTAEVRGAAALPAQDNDATLADMEAALIRGRLARFAGNKRRTAESLGIDRGTLYNRLKSLGITDV